MAGKGNSMEKEKQAQEELVLKTCEEAAKGVEGAREALRAELNMIKMQTVCRDFRPHLGNCRFFRPKCKFFPCNQLKNETRIALRDQALEEERREGMRAWQQSGKGNRGSGAGPSQGRGRGDKHGGGPSAW
eukprot:5218019-Pleurochrysis_carterae.AAC.3